MLAERKEQDEHKKLVNSWDMKLKELKIGSSADTWNMLEEKGYLGKEGVSAILKKTKDIGATADEILSKVTSDLKLEAKDKEILELKEKLIPKEVVDVDDPKATGSKEKVEVAKAADERGVVDYTKVDIEKLPPNQREMARDIAKRQGSVEKTNDW